MMTSCYGRLKQIREAGLVPVAISAGIPRWAGQLQTEKRLAPTRAMLGLPRAEYDRQFRELLDKLDLREIYDSLPENAVLLCWEGACKDACHRRIVAEAFEEKLGVVVTEFGFEREAVPVYEQMPWPEKK